MKSWKMLACDIFDAFTTHVGHVYDITDTDCWAQHDNIQSCFCDFWTSIFNKEDQYPSEKLL